MLDFLGEITQLTKILNMNMKLQEIFTNVTDVDRWFSQQNVGGPVFSSSLQLAQWNIYLRMCSLNPSLLQKVPVHPTLFTW